MNETSILFIILYALIMVACALAMQIYRRNLDGGGSVDMNPENTHSSGVPTCELDAPLAGYVVERVPDTGNPTNIISGTNGCVAFGGVLIENQLQHADGTWDTCKALTYTIDGEIRVYVEEAIPADTAYVCGASSRIRAYVVGPDNPLAIMGRTINTTFAAGDIAEATIEGGA